jgi:ABC-type dipeptide/oligopeptide/nickel transport system ATPase component
LIFRAGPARRIEGRVPNPRAGQRLPLHPRCPFAERCAREEPPVIDTGDGHQAACWKVPLQFDAAVAA